VESPSWILLTTTPVVDPYSANHSRFSLGVIFTNTNFCGTSLHFFALSHEVTLLFSCDFALYVKKHNHPGGGHFADRAFGGASPVVQGGIAVEFVSFCRIR
jgi:hypothetical protein